MAFPTSMSLRSKSSSGNIKRYTMAFTAPGTSFDVALPFRKTLFATIQGQSTSDNSTFITRDSQTTADGTTFGIIHVTQATSSGLYTLTALGV